MTRLKKWIIGTLACGITLSNGFHSAQAQTYLGSSEQQHIIDTVIEWSNAWSAQDIETYLSFYASDFQNRSGHTRAKWAQLRHRRITTPQFIDVNLHNIKVGRIKRSVRVEFTQIYRSDIFRSQSQKVMLLTKRGGSWKIKKELVNNRPNQPKSNVLIKWNTIPTSGQKDYKTIRRVLNNAWHSISKIYEHEARNNLVCEGEIQLRLTVKNTGHVSEAEIIVDSVGNLTLANVIREQAKQWYFKNLNKGTINIIVPFNAPQNRQQIIVSAN